MTGTERQSTADGDRAVLVVAEHGNATKIERHWAPLGDVADVTMVCLSGHDGVENVEFRCAPAPGHRLVGIAAMFLLALWECRRGDYDAVASISLFPYGCYALALGLVSGCPTHLGIIGSDLDRHAVSWYGAAVRAAFRRFTVVSVPGTDHRERLVEMGVPAERAVVLANAIDAEVFEPSAAAATAEYDFVWVGRFSPEKDPLLFVRGLAALRERGVSFSAAMVGTGELRADVERERRRHGLESALELTGWVDDPLRYYSRSRIYVLTSAREGLPLTLLEAMAVGLPAVVPDVGSVRDPVAHRETGYVVAERTPDALADAFESLLTEDGLRARLAENAPRVRDSYSRAAARDDWRAILRRLTRPEDARVGAPDGRPASAE